MGRPLDAVAALVGPGVAGDDVAAAVFDLVAAAVGRGPCVLVVEDLHWIDAASANLIDRIAQQPWPNLVVIAHLPAQRPVARPARRRARAAPRAPPLRRAGPPRPPRPHRGRGDGRGDLARHRWPAVVGVRRGAAPAQRRHPVRRRGADARRRPAADGGGPARGRAAVVAGGGRAPAARRARARPPAGRRGARRLRAGGVVRGPARRHRGRATPTCSTPCARSSPPASSSRSATTSSGSPTPSSPTPSSTSCSAASGGGCTSAASRPCGGPRCSTTPRWPTTPRAPTATTRCPAIARRGAARYLEKGLDVLGPAARRRGPGRGARTTPSCWPSPPRRRGGSTSSTRRSTRRSAGRRSPSSRSTASRPCGSSPASTTSSTTSRRRVARLAELEALWASLDDRRLRGVAALVARPGAHDQPPVDRGRDVGRAGARRRPGGRRHAHRGPRAGRAGGRQRRSAVAAARRSTRCTRRSTAARRSGDAVLLDAGDQQRPRARAVALGRGRRAARRDAGGQLAASASTSSARRRPWLWEFEAALRRRRPADAAPGGAPRARSGGAPSASGCRRRRSRRPRGGAAGRCRGGATPASSPAARRRKRQHYLRLDIALAAARGDRELGARLFEELLAAPPLLDTATLLNHVVVLVENLLTLGIAPDEIRAACFDGWLAEHPSSAAIRAHAEGLLLARRRSTTPPPRRRWTAVLADPDPCLAKPVIGSLRTALAEALLGAGDRAGALVAIRRVLDDDLGRWPGVRGPGRGARPAPAGRVDARRRRADRPRAGGRRPARRRADQRSARRAAVHLAEDGGRARVEHPRQARPVDAAPRSPPGPSATIARATACERHGPSGSRAQQPADALGPRAERSMRVPRGVAGR